MKHYLFTVQAISPVHVGSGIEMDPSEFLPFDDQLLRFSPFQVLADLDESERQRFQRLTVEGRLDRIQSFLRDHCDPERHGLEWIAMGPGFADAFKERVHHPDKRFEIALMPRSGECVYLPGSSLKGAIRTALVNHFIHADPERIERMRKACEQTWSQIGLLLEQAETTKRRVDREIGKELKALSDRLEQTALGFRPNHAEEDPLRALKVGDGMLPKDSTRIDGAYIHHPKKPQTRKIDLWLERIQSRVDMANEAPKWRMTITLSPEIMERAGLQSFDIKLLARACNDFYWRRFVAERERFHKRPDNKPTDRLLQLYRAMAPLFQRNQQGKVVVSKPEWPNLLVRVGRHSHFESLSVDDFRRGRRPQKKLKGTPQEWIDDIASTRTFCDLGQNGIPFGWLWLKFESAS